jgi:hypothetical protein
MREFLATLKQYPARPRTSLLLTFRLMQLTVSTALSRFLDASLRLDHVDALSTPDVALEHDIASAGYAIAGAASSITYHEQDPDHSRRAVPSSNTARRYSQIGTTVILSFAVLLR